MLDAPCQRSYALNLEGHLNNPELEMMSSRYEEIESGKGISILISAGVLSGLR